MIPDDLPSTFTYAQATAAGMTRHQLAREHSAGSIHQLGRGTYRRSDSPVADIDLLTIASRAPLATLCSVSALDAHGLTDIIPPRHDVALPRGAWHPRIDVPVRWHSFARETFEVDRGEVVLDATMSIGCYGPNRAVVDAFRLRAREGSDIAYEALRRWLRRGGQPAELLRVAEHFPRTVTALRHAIEVLE